MEGRRMEGRRCQDAPVPPAATTVAVAPGIELTVHDLGGSGRATIFAHATGFHGMVWRPVARRLPGHRCWAPDLRGHGGSDPPPDGDFRWAGFADDVLAVVDDLALDRPLGVGHSKGGAALLLAEQQRPGTFRGLWCWEPVVFPPDAGPPPGPGTTPPESPLARGARNRRDRFESRAAALANFAAKPPMDVFDAESLAAYVEHGFVDQPDGSVRLRCRPEDEAAVYEMAPGHGAWDHLREVACPVVVARGAEGGFGPAAFAGQVVERLGRGRLEVHDDLGHFGPMQDPARIAASVLAADA